MPLASDIQSPDVGEYVVMFDLDFTYLGGSIYYLSQMDDNGEPIVWRGNTYTKIGVSAEGFEMKSNGTLPRPKIQVDNMKSDLLSVVRTLNDGKGGKVVRWRTLSKYLDGKPLADPDMHFPKDIYVIEQKTLQTSLMIEWELRTLTDLEGKKLPGRQILRDFCSHTYRRWNGSSFVSHNTNPELITCPWVGGPPYITELGEITWSPNLDVCGKKLSDCVLRYGGNPLPTRAFPTVARTRSAA